MSSFVYNRFKAAIGTSGGANGGLDVDWNHSGVVVRLSLLTGGTYVEDADHDYWGDVSGNEFQDATYAIGGQVVDGRGITLNDAENTAEFTCPDETFSSLDSTAGGGEGSVTSCALWVATGDGNPANSLLVAHLSGADFPKAANGGDFTIQFASNIAFVIS